MPTAQSDSLRHCMAPHPTDPNLFCYLPVPRNELEHDGPHGWDYEKGEKAIITRSEFEADLDANGLGFLNERARWFATASDQERAG